MHRREGKCPACSLFVNGYVLAKTNDKFNDEDIYYKQAVNQLIEMGILQENPDDYMTRAEAVVAVLRFGLLKYH